MASVEAAFAANPAANPADQIAAALPPAWQQEQTSEERYYGDDHWWHSRPSWSLRVLPGETALQERPGTDAWDEGMAAISLQRFFNMSYDEFLAATVPCSHRVRSDVWAALAETEANLAYIPWNDDDGDPTPLQHQHAAGSRCCRSPRSCGARASARLTPRSSACVLTSVTVCIIWILKFGGGRSPWGHCNRSNH